MKIMLNNIIVNYDDNINIPRKYFDEISNNSNEISDFFNIKNFKLNIFLLAKENLDKYVSSVSLQYHNNVPNWLVGFSTSNSIHVILPAEKNLIEMINVTTHEIVHLLSYQLKNKNKSC